MSVKKDRRHLKMQEIGLPGNRWIFIITSLCPYYSVIFIFLVVQLRLKYLKIGTLYQ